LEEKSSSWTDHQLYDEAVKVVSTLGKDETNFFKLSLAIHEAAPRIETYNQYYSESVVPSLSHYDEQCQVWAQVGDKQYCDYEQLLEAIKSDKDATDTVEILSFDHIFCPDVENKDGRTIVLYTSQFSSEFKKFHDYLSKAVVDHNITYIVRYRPSISNVARGTPLYLSGYGVEMALKKTDYLVIDDRTSQGSSSCIYTNIDIQLLNRPFFIFRYR
jgi:UDP-glucose:glycoprotein glucosyltransferase